LFWKKLGGKKVEATPKKINCFLKKAKWPILAGMKRGREGSHANEERPTQT